MEKTLRFPKQYSLMTQQEMTYTTGGALTLYDVGALAGLSISIYSYVWGLDQSRRWLRENKKHSGGLGDTLNRAFDAVLRDMSKSLWHTIWDGYTMLNMAALWPITLVALITA